MRKIVSSILFFLTVLYSDAQTVRIPVSNVYTHLTAYTLQQADAFSIGANQASLANIKLISAGIYSERRFLLQELALYQAAVAVPTASGNFGFSGTYFGSISNKEMQLGLAYGRNLGKHLSVGAQFNYYTVQLAGYGNSSAINFEAGMLLHVTEQLHAGVHVYNPTNSVLTKGDQERLPAIYHLGIGYEASEQFFASVEIEKVENTAVSVNGGLQYSFDNKLFARGGFASGTASYILGFGVALRSFRLDVIASVHPQLGITPGLLLLFNRKEK